jgi:hypothetical protein
VALISRNRDRLEVEVEPVPPGTTTAVTSFTAICALQPGLDADRAQATLSALPVGVHSPFAASARTHFARLLVIEQLVTHQRRPLERPVLILAADVDGDAESYLVELFNRSGAALAPVLAMCAGAPADASMPGFAQAAATHLLGWQLPVSLQYANSPGRSVIDIRLAIERHRRLAGFALAHQHDSPEVLRPAFLEAFSPRPGATR